MSDITEGTNEPMPEEEAPRQLTEEEDPPYDLQAVNTMRVANGKPALTEEQAEAAIEARPAPDMTQAAVQTQGMYLVGLQSAPATVTSLDDGRMKVTPATPPRE